MRMEYLIEASSLVLRNLRGDAVHRADWDATIVIVGCGGTGSRLVPDVCRLLLGHKARLFLVDHDRVEPHNLGRQSFAPDEVGQFKAVALAARMLREFRQFGLLIGHAVRPYDPALHGAVFGRSSALNLVIGAVDNAEARRAIAGTLAGDRTRGREVWWLDAGNARNSGQLILGNAADAAGLAGAFNRATGRCRALPAPVLRRPALLTAPPEPAPRDRLDCAAAVAAGAQGPTINAHLATWAASYVERLLDGTCGWAETLIDVDAGTVRCIPIDPVRTARLVGLSIEEIEPPLVSAERAPRRRRRDAPGSQERAA
jgi:PRTRC genetic system ThiF family protein